MRSTTTAKSPEQIASNRRYAFVAALEVRGYSAEEAEALADSEANIVHLDKSRSMFWALPKPIAFSAAWPDCACPYCSPVARKPMVGGAWDAIGWSAADPMRAGTVHYPELRGLPMLRPNF